MSRPNRSTDARHHSPRPICHRRHQRNGAAAADHHDDLFSMVMSYNLHPRSERYEGEMSVNALDEATAKALAAAFAQDVAQAKHLAQSADVVVPKTAFSILARRFFFDQL